MKIRVLRNFGLDGENLEAGTIVTVNRSHFGDNVDTFQNEGYFEEVVEETATGAKPKKAEATKKPATSKKKGKATVPPSIPADVPAPSEPPTEPAAEAPVAVDQA